MALFRAGVVANESSNWWAGTDPDPDPDPNPDLTLTLTLTLTLIDHSCQATGSVVDGRESKGQSLPWV